MRRSARCIRRGPLGQSIGVLPTTTLTVRPLRIAATLISGTRTVSQRELRLAMVNRTPSGSIRPRVGGGRALDDGSGDRPAHRDDRIAAFRASNWAAETSSQQALAASAERTPASALASAASASFTSRCADTFFSKSSRSRLWVRPRARLSSLLRTIERCGLASAASGLRIVASGWPACTLAPSGTITCAMRPATRGPTRAMRSAFGCSSAGATSTWADERVPTASTRMSARFIASGESSTTPSSSWCSAWAGSALCRRLLVYSRPALTNCRVRIQQVPTERRRPLGDTGRRAFLRSSHSFSCAPALQRITPATPRTRGRPTSRPTAHRALPVVQRIPHAGRGASRSIRSFRPGSCHESAARSPRLVEARSTSGPPRLAPRSRIWRVRHGDAPLARRAWPPTPL